MESAYSELVGIFSAFYAAEVCFTAHGGGGEIDNEFARVHDDIMRMPLRADGNVGHRRTGAGNACPADSQNVRFFDSAAGYKCGRDRSEL